MTSRYKLWVMPMGDLVLHFVLQNWRYIKEGLFCYYVDYVNYLYFG